MKILEKIIKRRLERFIELEYLISRHPIWLQKRPKYGRNLVCRRGCRRVRWISSTLSALEQHRKALRYHGVPLYLRGSESCGAAWMAGDLSTETKMGSLSSRGCTAEFPQGQCLASTYRTSTMTRRWGGLSFPLGCITLCYADDTLVLAARTIGEKPGLRRMRPSPP